METVKVLLGHKANPNTLDEVHKNYIHCIFYTVTILIISKKFFRSA